MRRPRQALVDGLGALDVDVLFTVGHTVDPDTMGPIPPNMRVERFVPQAQVLSRTSLVVSHAGLGTMLGAIYHGVPMVTLVLGADHAINAASAADAGLALPVAMSEVDAERIATAATRALPDPALRAASDAVRTECANLEAVEGVVPLAETYAKTGEAFT